MSGVLCLSNFLKSLARNKYSNSRLFATAAIVRFVSNGDSFHGESEHGCLRMSLNKNQ
jgi:hypothetical protein